MTDCVYRLRHYASRTELVNASGQHVRWIPGPMAQSMVAAGSAAIHNQNGKVKSIRLLESAASHAWRLGPATLVPQASRFVVRERLEGGGILWKHHPRSVDYG
jgi:hypothetical protein